MEWYKEFLPSHEKKLEVIQFNDVYNVDEKEGDTPVPQGDLEKDADGEFLTNPSGSAYSLKGGAPRFIEALR